MSIRHNIASYQIIAGGKDDNQWDINIRVHIIQGRKNRMLLLTRGSLSVISVHTFQIFLQEQKEINKKQNKTKQQ